MKRSHAHLHRIAAVAVILLSIFTVISRSWNSSETGILADEVNQLEMDLYDRMDLAMQQEFDRTRDPLTGEVPRERLLDALNVIREQQANKRHYKAAISGITWNERGPKNVGGRLRALLFDANDASGKTAFAASVSGGLWKTTDLFAAQVEWTPVNDLFDNLSICALAQDPSDPDILYFGTGEGYFNVDAVRGNGIWKST
ncbi:MAG: hypothetical protein KDC76_12530, partial [Bacteroidetes bacterium]|nr:hypothetical protein [Bacteroidota bacterium]